jgi:hypothetical protein
MSEVACVGWICQSAKLGVATSCTDLDTWDNAHFGDSFLVIWMLPLLEKNDQGRT